MSVDVSVVIPCFNSQAFVGQAIASALNQTYHSLEVVVVDDGSTDDSLKVIQSFGGRIRWESGPNRGGCAARNRGVKLARGKFIQFLDADDMLLPRKIELQIQESALERGELVFCDGASLNGGSVHAHWVRADDPSDSVVFMLKSGLPTPSPLHYRWWLEAIGGFNERLPCSQERDLHLRIAALGVKFRRLPQVLFNVRAVEGSVSHNVIRVLDQHLSIAKAVREMLIERGTLTEPRAMALAAFLARDARMYFQRRCFDKGRTYFAAAREMHPSGGIHSAYSPLARYLRALCGPVLTERMVAMRRSVLR